MLGGFFQIHNNVNYNDLKCSRLISAEGSPNPHSISKPLTQSSSKVINVEVPHFHVTIKPGPIPSHATCCHGNRGYARSLVNKRGQSRVRVLY